MKRRGVEQLTDAQRDVLRRWQRRESAKEIARDLGITHWAVNERLRAARRALGASSSSEAARILAEAEAGETYKRVVYEPGAVAGGAEPDMMSGSEADGEAPLRQTRGSEFREERVPYRARPLLGSEVRLPIPRYRGDSNDLTIKARLIWIGALALGLVIAVGALITISWGVVRMVGHIIRTLS